jgi:SAM domain (Sterile alpha motif)
MNASSLSEWLKSYDLEQFVHSFEENEVDLATLRVLTESDLKELGLPFGPRKRILHLLGEEKALDKAAAAVESVDGRLESIGNRAASAYRYWLGEFATARRPDDQALPAHQAMEANARRRGHPFDFASALAIGVKVFDSLDRGFERLVETGHRIWTWYLRLCEMRGKL